MEILKQKSNKMKNLLFTFLFLGCFTPIFSQISEEVKADKTIQFGVNATTFIKTFLSFNDSDNSNPDPYLFTAKIIKGNKAFRAGLGLNLTTTKEVDSDERVIDFHDTRLRLGHEWRYDVHKRWKAYVGFDGFVGHRKLETETSFNFGNVQDFITLREKEFSLGTGFIGGIEYYINDKLSLYTETSLMYVFSKSKNDDEFSSSRDDIKTQSFNINLPVSIFFAISF